MPPRSKRIATERNEEPEAPCHRSPIHMAAVHTESTESTSMPTVMLPVISFNTPMAEGATTPARFPNEFTRARAIGCDTSAALAHTGATTARDALA
jgi:hypothetical protein